MFKRIERAIHNLSAAFMRVLIIFLILSIGFDSLTRLYYSYMPIETWMDFQSVEVVMRNGEATAIIKRRSVGRSLSIFHRTLIIRYPDERRNYCTNSVVTIIDDPTVDTVYSPIANMLSEKCPEILGDRTIDGVLQVSYIFEFPYGVKRFAVRYSNRFSLKYEGKYEVGPPLFSGDSASR